MTLEKSSWGSYFLICKTDVITKMRGSTGSYSIYGKYYPSTDKTQTIMTKRGNKHAEKQTIMTKRGNKHTEKHRAQVLRTYLHGKGHLVVAHLQKY